MITFFTTAKSFLGEARRRQYNAIRSWKALHPDIEVLLFGKGEGYEQAVRELHLVHIPDVGTNEQGLPRVDSMFALAGQRARHACRAYINCDIVLLDDFLPALRRIPCSRFLMVSQRWTFPVENEIDFNGPEWSETLRRRVRSSGTADPRCAVDFFLTKGPVWENLPPMVVGRGMYDHWLIYHCRSRGIPVVDVSDVVTVIHQQHEYAHIQGGRETVELGDEARRNLELGGGYRHMFTIQDAEWCLTAKGMERNWCREDAQRCAEVFHVLHEGNRFLCSPFGYGLALAWSELAIRLNQARGGNPGSLFKYGVWLVSKWLDVTVNRRKEWR